MSSTSSRGSAHGAIIAVGEFLLMLVNTDWWIRFASLLPHHSMEHPALNTARWRGRLEDSGFEVTEQGTRPATLYFVSRKQ